MTKRIGFCCKWIDTPEQMNGFKPKDDAKRYNTGTTTITWLNRQTRAVAEQKLWDLMCNNLNSTRLLLKWFALAVIFLLLLLNLPGVIFIVGLMWSVIVSASLAALAILLAAMTYGLVFILVSFVFLLAAILV